MKNKWIILTIACALFCLGACEKQPPADNTGNDTPSQQEQQQQEDNSKTLKTRYYVNFFSFNMMDLYYLWKKEIAAGLKAWTTADDPVATVASIRYKDAQGKDIDRWSMVIDDFESFYGDVSGNGKTYGFDFILMYYDQAHTTICAVVTYTYPGSPAETAGLKRGDAIVQVNGTTMTPDNYTRVYRDLYSGDKLTVGVAEEKTGKINSVNLDAKEMYENPVLLSKVFDCGDKKVGYLVYTSFTLDSYKDLIAACTAFKEAGVSELILDLRYNGGGFALAEQFLASMLAPESVVQADPKNILSTEVFNAEWSAYFKENGKDTNTYFETDFSFESGTEKVNFSTKDANIGLEKLYAIIGSGSASASEALLCDLFPYMSVTLVGEQTHGKFCTGLMINALKHFYEDKDYATQLTKEYGSDFIPEAKTYAKNWGIYVMHSRFADRDGVTRCMPDGLKPDVEVEDLPYEPYQLGDPREVMLAATLKLCGYKPTTAPKQRSLSPDHFGPRIQTEPLRADFGRFIVLPEELPLRRTK